MWHRIFSKILDIAGVVIKWSFIVTLSSIVAYIWMIAFAFFTGDLIGWSLWLHVCQGIMAVSFGLMVSLWLFFAVCMLVLTRRGA